MIYNFSVNKINEDGREIRLLNLFIPTFFESVFVLLLSTVNTIMISGYSQDGVTAINVANQVHNLAVELITMLITGMSVLISIELGKDNKKGAFDISGTAILWCIIGAVSTSVVIFVFSNNFVSAMNLEGELLNLSAGYLRVKMLFLPILIIMRCLTRILISYGYASLSFVIGIVSNVFNCTFIWTFLYSGINFKINPVARVAIANGIAQIISLLIAVYFIKIKGCCANFSFNFSLLKKILKLGVPSGMCTFSFSLSQTITTSFIVSFGALIVNAKIYVSNIVSYTSNLSYSIAKANALLVGRYKGRQDFKSMGILVKQNLFLALICNLCLSIAVYFLREPLIGLFTTDKRIVEFASNILLIDIVVEVARAVNHIMDNSLNANGDVKVTFAVSTVSNWVFSVGLSYVLGVLLNLGIFGCWIAFMLDEIAKSIVYLLRWRSGKFKKAIV